MHAAALARYEARQEKLMDHGSKKGGGEPMLAGPWKEGHHDVPSKSAAESRNGEPPPPAV